LYTAKKLIEEGHEVLIVDKNKDQLEEIGEQLDCGMMHGDGTLPSVQREAFGDHADALVLLTNVDNVNILSAVVGRSVGFERVIPQIVGTELLAVCSELGLDDLITPHQTVARSIVNSLENDDEGELQMSFDENHIIRRFYVGESLTEKSIENMELPETCRVIGVIRDDAKSLVTDKTEVKKGDCLVILLEQDSEKELESLFDNAESVDD
jgi:trk system potassium uptake protein TrkA